MSAGGRIEALMTIPAGVSASVTNSGGGATTVTITAGTYYITTLAAHFQAQLIALRPPSTGTWAVTLSTGVSGTGKITIDCTDGVSWSITWTSTTLRDILGFTANITTVTTAQTGASQARGLWLPACPLNSDSDVKIAPRGSDHRNTVGPTGEVYGLVGNLFYRHKNLRYAYVPVHRAWTSKETTTNASWETFFHETQLGQNSSWFSVTSKVRIYFDDAGVDTLVGNIPWKIVKPAGLDEIALADGKQWAGLVQIHLGDIFSTGS